MTWGDDSVGEVLPAEVWGSESQFPAPRGGRWLHMSVAPVLGRRGQTGVDPRGTMAGQSSQDGKLAWNA